MISLVKAVCKGCIKKITLRDGSATITLRPLLKNDREREVEMFSLLSPQSIYFRFLSPHPSLTDAELDYFLNNDFVGSIAIAATITQEGREHILGVVRYYTEEKDKSLAEFAIVVQDAWQKKGIGTAMMRHLCEIGRRKGVKTFFALAFKDNDGLFGMLDKLGLEWEKRKFDEDTVRVEVFLV